MRAKKAILSSITALLLQFVSVICGLILPQMIMRTYGSEINGAVSSIAQFLGYIALVEAGVGGVSRAALYKPLADNNKEKISGIINATEKFFRCIALIFIAYSIVIAFIFPYITTNELDHGFTFWLVLIIALSTFAQYYFGITYTVLLNADQKNYILNILQIATLIINTAISVVLIRLGFGIHIIKLMSALIYIIRPVFLCVYVRKRYKINKKIPVDNIAIKARWNGLGQHIAFFIYNSTDIVIISVFLGMRWVSVYSVYYMVCAGIGSTVTAITGGTEAAFGNMIAKKEKDNLNRNFRIIETLSSALTVMLFSITGLMLLDFIRIYTFSVNDVNYIIFPLAILMTVTEALKCIKSPYNSVVLAAGHYKETQIGAYIEAGINIGLSIVGVYFFGIAGVLIGTIIATLFRTLNYVHHLKANILIRNIGVYLKRQVINILNVFSILAACYCIRFSQPQNYIEWILKAIPVSAISFIITFAWNYIFYKTELFSLITHVSNAIKSRIRQYKS